MSTAWVQTYTGRRFDLLEPTPHLVTFKDIGHALANTCRFNGHCDRFYSVAEHCVVMSHMVPSSMAKWALFHDAAESYIGDMVRPLKEIMPDFRQIEARIEQAVAEKFRLGPRPKSLSGYDLRMLATEARQIMEEPPNPWLSTIGVEPFDVVLACWPPEVARLEFARRFGEIQGEECLRECREGAAS